MLVEEVDEGEVEEVLLEMKGKVGEGVGGGGTRGGGGEVVGGGEQTHTDNEFKESFLQGEWPMRWEWRGY